MINHKHHLVENGIMLSCDSVVCPTHGKPFLLAGGDEDPGGWEDDAVVNLNEEIERLKREIKVLKEINKQLEKKIEALDQKLKDQDLGFSPFE